MGGKLLLIAAGGTGGHMFPAQALAEVMLERGWRVQLSTDDRGARYAGGFPAAVKISKVSSATFARGGALTKALVPLRILGGIFGATAKMLVQRPAVVVGFGGYPTIPALSAATLLRRPRMIHEANGVLGRVNKRFAPKVNKVACGIWPTDLPAGSVSVHTGNPVRAAVLKRAGAPYIPPGDYPMQILVIGGSQGAKILSDVVPSALAALPEEVKRNLRVAHQARDADAEAAKATYAAAGIRAEVEPFFTNIAERLAEAQLVVSRSGASSVADISVIGRPSILIPYAAAMDDHQTANARGLADAGGAIVIQEKALDVGGLSAHIAALLGEESAARRMAANALSQGKPDAVLQLAALVEELAGE